VRFHIQQDSDIPASTQLNNQICFAIAARHFPPGHRLPSTRQLAMQTGLHRNTISKVYRQLEIDGVVEAIAGSGIYVRDNLTKKDFKKSVYSKNKISKHPDQEVKQTIDKFINLGCTLQEAREILTKEIEIKNTDRSVCAKISGVIAELHGNTGFNGELNLNFKGYAGQSFGAFLLKGMNVQLIGEANDYV